LSSILYYITGHGFGHTVRSVQVLRSLKGARPELSLEVRSTAPEWLIEHPRFRVAYSPCSLDVGMIQRDSLEMDLDETLRACQMLDRQAEELVKEETNFIRQQKIKLILGDIPALCFEVASRATVPSIAIANFTWSWIYRRYAADYPGFSPVIEQMESFYTKATLALDLPYSVGMDIFPERQAIPWISRVSALTKQEARSRFALPQLATIVLLSFGGIGLDRLHWDALKRAKDLAFVATGNVASTDGNLFRLPDEQSNYEDLVRAVDVIVSKPGYGIVADSLSHRVPLLYTERGTFPEYPLLVEALNDNGTAAFIPQKELLAGNIGPYVTALLGRESRWCDIRLDGANVAAEKVLAVLDRYT
jgi:UDP:flavonoid glycosyltransferase YjiC (YdhE family)